MSGCGGLALICISIVVNVDGGEAGTCFLNLDTSSSRGLFFFWGGGGEEVGRLTGMPSPLHPFISKCLFFLP